ncbi:MAG: branched-chain amino acid ABC transporter permease [Betaproteobacteria bacterium]|nr:branched-chain amino acid ABC transporter permease [Betaproteobacteria bacterium]MBI2961418.1 branched-chain amino acid ABC transporter permease [Betaproteobacteria bacterium]
MEPRQLAAAAMLATLAALAALPFFGEKFTVQLFTKILIMAIFAMSLDLLIGFTGLVSFGHAAFFGVAGYILALLTPQYEAANLWTSLPIAVAGSALAALAIGLLVLRTAGLYFIMVTLAFAQMLFFLFHDTKIAGGADGIYVYVRPAAEILGWKPFDLENFVHLYLVVLALFVLVFLLLRVVLASLFGRVIEGIRVNEHRMRSLGYPTFRYKLACFVLAGALAGLAGYLSAIQFGFVNPDMLGWHLSGEVMMMVILGGMGTLIGPALGAAAMMLVEIAFQALPTVGSIDLGKHWQLFMGSFIVLVVLFLPHGLLGLLARVGAVREGGDG